MGNQICSQCGTSGYYDNYQSTPQGWVWNKSYGMGRKIFCSNKCLNENNSSSNSGKIESQKNSEEAKANAAEAKANAEEAKAKENTAKWNTYAQLGTAAFSAASSTGKEIKEITDYLSKMIFSNDADELGNQLSEICSIWGGAEKYIIKDNTVAVKKAAFDKFEFGLMKLQQVGQPQQIDFFTKKQKEMKPKRFGLF